MACPNCRVYQNFFNNFNLIYQDLLLDLKKINSEPEFIQEINSDGIPEKKIKSDLGGNFIILDNYKDISELNISQINKIKSQDNLNKLDNIKTNLAGVYNMGYYIISFGKFIFPFL